MPTDSSITDRPAATTPLSGAELVPIVQGGVTKHVAASEIGGGSGGSIYVTFPGSIAVQSGLLRWYPKSAITVTSVRVDMGGAPVTSDAVFNLRKNGVAIFTSPKPTVTAGNHSSTPLTVSVALTTSDYLTPDIEVATGTDAVMRIDYQ